MTTAISPTSPFFSAQLKSGLTVPRQLAPQFGLDMWAVPDDGFSMTDPESLELRALARAHKLGVAMVHDGSPEAIRRAAGYVGVPKDVRVHPVAPAEKTFEFVSVRRGHTGGSVEQGVHEIWRAPDPKTIIYYQVNLGERPNGGYAIHVRRVVQSEGQYYIYYEEKTPALDAPASKVITKPYELITVWNVPEGAQFVLKNVDTTWRQIPWQTIDAELIEHNARMIPGILDESHKNLILAAAFIVDDLVEDEFSDSKDYAAQVVGLLVHLSAIFYKLESEGKPCNRQEYFEEFGLDPRGSLVKDGIAYFDDILSKR